MENESSKDLVDMMASCGVATADIAKAMTNAYRTLSSKVHNFVKTDHGVEGDFEECGNRDSLRSKNCS